MSRPNAAEIAAAIANTCCADGEAWTFDLKLATGIIQRALDAAAAVPAKTVDQQIAELGIMRVGMDEPAVPERANEGASWSEEKGWHDWPEDRPKVQPTQSDAEVARVRDEYVNRPNKYSYGKNDIAILLRRITELENSRESAVADIAEAFVRQTDTIVNLENKLRLAHATAAQPAPSAAQERARADRLASIEEAAKAVVKAWQLHTNDGEEIMEDDGVNNTIVDLKNMLAATADGERENKGNE